VKASVLVLGACLSLASVNGAFAADVKFKGGVWKGDVGATVRAVYIQNGKDATIEGKLVKIEKSFIKIEVVEAGKTVTRTIVLLDLKKLETVGGSAPSGEPSGAAPKTGATGSGAKKATGATEATGTAGDKPKPTIFVLPWEGMVGTGARHEQIAQIGEVADRLGNGQVIVIHVDSPGGLVLEGDQIHATLVDLKQRHKVVAWVKKAISAGAYTSLHCDEIYFERVGNLGAITMFAGTEAAKGQQLDAWLEAVGEACRIGGRHPAIGRAMVTNPELLSYDRDDAGNVVWYGTLEGKYKLSDAEQNLSFNAETAVHSKFSQGLADNLDELLVHLSKDDVKISQAGYDIHRKWQDTLKQCKEAKRQALRDLQNPGGLEDMTRINNAIKALETILRWYDRCEPGMMYDDPGLGPRERWEQELATLKKDRARMREQN
jgi:hypothetical protein